MLTIGKLTMLKDERKAGREKNLPSNANIYLCRLTLAWEE